MDKFQLKAQKRKLTGRKVKSLRKEGLLPANIFGKKITSQAIKLNLQDFEKVYADAGETNIINLQLNKSKVPVLISNVQVDPLSDLPLHVDFHQVDLKEKVTASVPILLTGEAPAEKNGLGTLVHQLTELDVVALPTNLPENLSLDLSPLKEVDDALYVKDFKVNSSKVTIEAEPDQIVAKIEPLQEEEVVPPPPSEGPEEEEAEAEEEAESPEAQSVPPEKPEEKEAETK